MFTHHFKYTFITLFKNKSLLFWTFAFPLILGLFFHLAFSDIEDREKLEPFPIAIVDTKEWKENTIYKETFASLSDESNEDRLFEIQYVTEGEAKELLESKKIEGYLILENNEKKIVTMTNGVQETILKYVVDEINETTKIVANLTQSEMKKGSYDIDKIVNRIKEKLATEQVYTNDVSSENLSYMLIEFYSLVAMTCLYGGVVVMTSLNQSLANMSSIGKRVNVSPVQKWKVILSSMLASFIVELLGVALLMIFTRFVLQVDFGSQILYIILLSVVGTLAGLALGLIVAIAVKAHENTKVGVIIAISMTFSILAGMTGVTLKYMIDKNIPLINKLNPANMITDGFYSLYYYDTLDRYMFNLVSLLLFAIFFIVVSCIILRRQKYDSI